MHQSNTHWSGRQTDRHTHTTDNSFEAKHRPKITMNIFFASSLILKKSFSTSTDIKLKGWAKEAKIKKINKKRRNMRRKRWKKNRRGTKRKKKNVRGRSRKITEEEGKETKVNWKRKKK